MSTDDRFVFSIAGFLFLWLVVWLLLEKGDSE